MLFMDMPGFRSVNFKKYPSVYSFLECWPRKDNIGFRSGGTPWLGGMFGIGRFELRDLVPFGSDTGDDAARRGDVIDVGFSLEDEPPINDENEKTIDIYSVLHTCSIPAKCLKNISMYVPFTGAMVRLGLRSEKCLSSLHPFDYLSTRERVKIRLPFAGVF